MSKVWFITGASKGFGHEWAQAALERGDQVVGTVRTLSSSDELVKRHGDAFLPLQLDVTDREAAFAAVHRAATHFGRLDVVVNNAGYGHIGMIEEISESEARSQLETNLLGALWVSQAAVGVMRAQGSGHIIQVSSIGGVTAFPAYGIYNAAKWGLEGFSQALSQEVAGFGITVTLVEPGPFASDFAGSSARMSAPIEAYTPLREAAAAASAGTDFGDPRGTRSAILAVVDAPQPPLRVFFGPAPLRIIEHDYENRLATWRQWQPIAETAQTP